MAALLPRMCILWIWGISAALISGAQAHPTEAPLPAGQEKILAAMRHYADQYISNLPNFLCIRTVEQFEAGKKPGRWHRGDTLTFRLSFSNGREEHFLEQVNHRPVSKGHAPWRTPLQTEGEFGLFLSRIFAPETQTSFAWSHSGLLEGKTVAVFNYSVAREHSSLRLSRGDEASAIVPYQGALYADPATGAIWRVTSNAFDIPPNIRTESILTTIDYDQVPIGPQLYLLPVRANVRLITPSGNIRNEIQFDAYRKFETDSTVTYASEAGKGADHTAESSARTSHPPFP